MKYYKFTSSQVAKLENNIIVLVDTREKKNDHILQYFNKYGIKYSRQKLDYGDYSFLVKGNEVVKDDLYFHNDIVIERKATLEELSRNLAQDRERFEKELLKAKSDGCKIWLDIENPFGYNAIMQKKYNTDFNPKSFIGSLKTFESRYNLHINFLDKIYMGYNIKYTFIYFLRDYFK